MSSRARLAHTPAATASWPMEGWMAPSTTLSSRPAQGLLLEGADAQHQPVVTAQAVDIDIGAGLLAHGASPSPRASSRRCLLNGAGQIA